MNYDAPPPQKRTSPWLILAIVAIGSTCLCCGGLVAWGFVGGSQLFQQASTSMAEITALTSRISIEFHEPNVTPGINRSTDTTSATRTILTIGLSNSPVPSTSRDERVAHAIAIARFVKTNANPAWNLTTICVEYADTTQVPGGAFARSTDPHCFEVPALDALAPSSPEAPVPSPAPQPTTPEPPIEPSAPVAP